jgi:NADH:ubiquinone oxidoreductase subunit 5 (subunit L)/multisubunit Na+/H+ antiporter MnhA subunit
MRERGGLWLWPLLASARLREAVSQHWKRILVGAFVGWLCAVIGGAVALAGLELHNVISRTTSDDLGVVLVLYGVGLGALNAYTFRPRATALAAESTATRSRPR